MAEPIYQHELDGQEVEQEDINLLGMTSGLADDRVLAELLRLVPYNGTTVAKAILPYTLPGDNTATVTAHGAFGGVKVMPFRAIIGSRTSVTADPLAAWRDIRSAVYAQSVAWTGNLGNPVPLAPNTTTLPRWDLVYAAFTPDANGGSVTRYVRDPATGAISAPSVVTTLVQNVVVMVAQGTPSATPSPPAVPADGGGTYYIALAYVQVAPGFSASSSILAGSIYSVAPVISLARTAGSFSLQPANQQFVPNGAALTAARIQTWGNGPAARPGFFLPGDMVGGESRFFAIDFTIPGWSHGGVLATVDDSRDWRNRSFRWTCMAKAAAAGQNPTFSWQLPQNAASLLLPSARSLGVGQDIQFGFGQSFVSDVNDNQLNGGMAMLVDPSSGGANLPGPMTAITDTVGLMADLTDGKLKVYTRANANPKFAIFIWLDATAPYPNWN